MTQSTSTYSEKLDLGSKKEDSIKNQWWTELRHGGLLLSPAVLEEMFPEGPEKLEEKRIEKLYDAYIKYITTIEKFSNSTSKLSEALYRWIDAIFDQFLDVPATSWIKENKVPEDLKINSSIGEKLRPNRVLTYLKEYRYLIKIDKQAKTLGLGKSKRECAKFLELLRKTKIQLGVYTNGHQIRLIYAGMDHDSWIEWDVERWFGDPIGEELLTGFFHLCGRSLNFNKVEDKWALLHYVQYSRIKQSDLSSVLGNQVREAVEILLEILDIGVRDIPELLDPLKKLEITQKQRLNALYQASIRIIMRLVVVFFAEARELFPRSLERYDQSYGLEGLFRILTEAEQDEGSEILKNNVSGWTRVLALFNLIYDGSPFSDIPIRPYGGALFRPGNSASEDLTLKAISIFENSRMNISDYIILQILRKLKIGSVKVKKGRSFTWVHGPVDFSELSAEYIGMMYEGLLDYQVRQVSPEEEAIVILRLGRQPALPITRLESLEEKELKELIQNLSKEKTIQVIKEEESEEEEDDQVEEEEEEEEENEEFQTTQEELYQRALKWAKEAVEKAKQVKKTKKMTDDDYEKLLEEAGKKIISKEGIYGQGQYYLIQNSGNRKGSGTFYTKPQLVIPTVQRTLEPLVYDVLPDGRKIPQTPETILSLKVCDPAMGSASFLVAALRYLSDTLYDSLIIHKKVKPHNSSKTIISIPLGTDPSGNLKEDTFTVYATEINEKAEIQIKSRLKRHIMENCIYGVDINSLAVELAKLSLWIETMDRDLPFNFIDHKLKVGNSMIGCYLSDFRDYPLMAWEREAGDSSHNNGIHFKKKQWTLQIKKIKNEVIKREMVNFLKKLSGQTEITRFLEELNEKSKQLSDSIYQNYLELHNINKFDITQVSDNEKKEKFFEKYIKNSEGFQKLKTQMDSWCAIWFWDPDNLENCPNPSDFLQPEQKTLNNVLELLKKYKFFHWELEFPDVFFKNDPGFNAIIGNPPWETLKQSSMEYYSKIDPIYRTYGKQFALKKQKEFFKTIKDLERDWLLYTSYFKAFKNWVNFCSNPSGDYEIGKHFNLAPAVSHWTKSKELHDVWRETRKKNRSRQRYKQKRFIIQGKGEIMTYKVFLELAITYTSNKGRIGLIIPASIYGDLGALKLRKYLLDKCRWEHLFSFENRKKIFKSIHGSFKFCVNIIEKHNSTEKISIAFMQRDVTNWENYSKYILNLEKEKLLKYSPKHNIFLEIETEKDNLLLSKLYDNKILLGDKSKKSWNIEYHRELDTTNDSKHFPSLQKWVKNGYKKDNYCQWINSEGKIALPVYEGRMVGQFDFSRKGWVSGKGRSAKWREIPFEDKTIEPQYLISKDFRDIYPKAIHGYEISIMDVTSATNERTMISFLDRDSPHVSTAPILYTKDHTLKRSLILIAIFNSFVFDYITRIRTSGIHITYFKLEESPLPYHSYIDEYIINKIIENTSKLSFLHIKFAPDWLLIKNILPDISKTNWRKNWTITFHERQRLRAELEAIIAYLYNINIDDLKWILRNDESNAKGFWRVDNDKPESIRLTTLTLKAFEELNQNGIESFCKKDWQIPKEVQDEFKEQLGPRFLEWQLEESIENSWKECEEHTKNILREEKYKEFKELLNEGKDPFAIWARDYYLNKSKNDNKKNENKERQSKSEHKKNKDENPKFKDIGDFIK